MFNFDFIQNRGEIGVDRSDEVNEYLLFSTLTTWHWALTRRGLFCRRRKNGLVLATVQGRFFFTDKLIPAV
jgi:hypothetical protein